MVRLLFLSVFAVFMIALMPTNLPFLSPAEPHPEQEHAESLNLADVVDVVTDAGVDLLRICERNPEFCERCEAIAEAVHTKVSIWIDQIEACFGENGAQASTAAVPADAREVLRSMEQRAIDESARAQRESARLAAMREPAERPDR